MQREDARGERLAPSSRPSLSVMISNYNHARLIPQALDAILSQSYRPHEIVIIDDASTDDSLAVLDGYQERWPELVRLVKNERNLGVLHNGQTLFSMATGDYVYFAAMDDRILPGFFERSMDMLVRYPDAGVCSALSHIMNESGTVGGLVTLPVVLARSGFLNPSEALTALRQHGNWFQGNTVILRRAALIEADGFRRELGPYCDGFVYLVIALKCGACYIPEPLAIWRRMDGTFSHRANSDLDFVLAVFDHAERLMRSDYRDLFPPDYVDDWKREIYFGVASTFATQTDGGLAQLQRIVPAATAVDRGFYFLARTWPALSRRLAKAYLFTKFRRGHLWRTIGRRLTHARLRARAVFIERKTFGPAHTTR